MADKQASLSIIIRTVDKATAGIQAVNKRLDEMTKPTREFGKALGELRDKSGFSDVADGFKGVGGAVSDLIGKVALVGGAVAVAVAGVLSLVDHFDQLGDTAERLGTSADFLAAFRYAAERAGAPLEAVDAGLQTLVTNMGAAKAGTGKMLKFLNQISPALARQVTAANSLEEALGLLAEAESKLPDAARRSKLAAATLGDPALAPLLARGAAGVQELLTEFYALAGSQGEAADAAGKTDDALKKMHAATEGAKAALVAGLSPALTVIIDKMTEWLVEHRTDVAKWAEDIGKKLPGAVDDLTKSIRSGVREVTGFIESIGGWKIAAVGIAAVISGPLILSLAKLSIALLATPFGQIVLGIAAVTAGIMELTGFVKGLIEAFDTLHERMLEDSVNLPSWKFHQMHPELPDVSDELATVDAIRGKTWSMANSERAPWMIPGAPARLDGVVRDSQGPVADLPTPPPAEVRLKVDFMHAPKGMRVTADPANGASVDLTTGYQLGAP